MTKVIAGLSRNADVQAVLQIGSLRQQQLSPDSDYDLVLVLANLAEPWFVGVTEINGRFTDLIFVNQAEIDKVNALETAVAHNHPLAPIIRWLRDGEVLFSRQPIIATAQEKVQQQAWILPTADETRYQTWFSINYNLAQTRRMLASAKPLYQQTAVIRMANYAHADVWFGYFTLRGIEWRGDKTAVSYLQQHDPAFLAHYQALISCANPTEKFGHYQTTAAIAAQPLGGLWQNVPSLTNVKHEATLWKRLFDHDACCVAQEDLRLRTTQHNNYAKNPNC
ncbi:MAG: hypothetical protein AAF614_35310 [Chloroflexota bacterium]